MLNAVQRSAVGEGNARARPLCLHCAHPVKLATEAARRVDQKLLYDKLRCGMARDMPVVRMSVRHPSRIARATTFVPTLYSILVLSVPTVVPSRFRLHRCVSVPVRWFG